MKEEASMASREALLRGLALMRRSRACACQHTLWLAGWTYVGPGIAVLRGQAPDGRGALCLFVDLAELRLQLGRVELLAADLVLDLEKLVPAHDDDVGVLLGGVLDGVVCRLGGDAAGVEHPLVAGHGHRQLPHVFRLESPPSTCFLNSRTAVVMAAALLAGSRLLRSSR